MKKIIPPIILCFLALAAQAQKMTTEEYIKAYKDLAIENMQLKKVPASITLAQGILESGNGNSNLARFANNHFGIKCHNWTGDTYHQDDDAPNECFRKYKTVLDSYKDHADFLSGKERYAALFQLELTDYKGWARGLKSAGYATSPTYADQLISLIERYKLYEYDQNGGPVVTQNNNNTTNSNTNNNTHNGNNTSNTNNQEPPVKKGELVYINGLKAIKVGKGQTKGSIATDFELRVQQVEKYNELGELDEVHEGQIIFLEPKRGVAANGNDYHIVKAGDTFYSIAHSYGMKTDALLKKNRLWYGSSLKPGDKLWLRHKKPLVWM